MKRRNPFTVFVRRIAVAAAVLFFLPVAEAAFPGLRGDVYSAAFDTLEGLTDLFDIEMDGYDELKGELASAIALFDEVNQGRADAERAITAEDPFIVVDSEGVERDGQARLHRYAPPDLGPELVDAVRILRSSL